MMKRVLLATALGAITATGQNADVVGLVQKSVAVSAASLNTTSATRAATEMLGKVSGLVHMIDHDLARVADDESLLDQLFECTRGAGIPTADKIIGITHGIVSLRGNCQEQENAQKRRACAKDVTSMLADILGAHWCPPCRGFTPKLAEWYTKDLKALGMEVVFVSSDKEEDAFKGYFAEQPWLALPYSDRERKTALSKKFKVQGIPTLVILDSDGKTITTDGRSAVSSDPTGKEFPWPVVPPKELLVKAKIVNSSRGSVLIADALKNKKALALYFSAHWCPPCKGFTPKLAEWYKKDLSAKGLEVIFVSSDRDEESFKEYFGEMPWLALDYSDRAMKEKLSKAFGVSGIPTVVILDPELNLITKDGRSAVSGDPEGLELPWFPKPVSNLKQGPGDINEVPTVLLFCESSEASEKKAFEDVLTPIAEECISKAKAAGEDPEFAFTIVTEGEDLAGRIRGMVGLEGVKEPRLVLMDIPDNGGYYLSAVGASVSADAVEAFLEDYKAKKLERKQLK